MRKITVLFAPLVRIPIKQPLEPFASEVLLLPHSNIVISSSRDSNEFFVAVLVFLTILVLSFLPIQALEKKSDVRKVEKRSCDKP